MGFATRRQTEGLRQSGVEPSGYRARAGRAQFCEWWLSKWSSKNLLNSEGETNYHGQLFLVVALCFDYEDYEYFYSTSATATAAPATTTWYG